MHVKLINKNLYFGKYKVKCAIGKRGITSKKSEGDKKTPTGRLKFVSMFYRKDRIKKIRANIKKKSIKKNMGWCDDYRSKYYNKLIQFPFKYSAEKLFLKKNIYNIILVLDFNMNPVIKKKGSAIFMHISNKKYSPTNGCIAISLKDMKSLLKNITKRSSITIY